jgi:tripartite-type tricarboxylate transporter receptor subunit TctC
MDRQPYDVNKDFIPVALLARVPNLFVVNAESVPAKDFKEFIALAKAKPGQLNYGSAGNGSAGHLAFEYLKMVTETDITHVPYRGTGPQLQDSSAAGSTRHPPERPRSCRTSRAGSCARSPWGLRPHPGAARRADRRRDGLSGLRDVAVVRRAGSRGHAARDRAQAERRDEQGAALGHVTQRYAADNAAISIGIPEDFAAFISKEQARWEKVVKRSNLKIE